MADRRPPKRAPSHLSPLVPLPHQDAIATPLPAPLTAFIGREQDVATVTAILLRPEVRLVTLTGPGGIGKTRLAVQIGHQLAEHVADGIAFVPLAAVRDPDLVLPAVAQILNVPDAVERPLLDRVTAILAERQLLLVLDNLEHLRDTTTPLIVDLLTTCPGLTVLTTSRTRLGILGERVIPVAPLDPETARTLFAQRAEEADPSFAVTPANASVIDAICHRVDRLPLAIELAAARITVLPPRALLARLDQRLELLSEGARAAPDRQRDMRAAITWSYELLSDSEQRLFRRLGVFVGGFTLDAADAVAGEGADVLRGIGALVAASLVLPAAGSDDEARFTLLETIREYALEQLAASGEEEAARRAHADYFRDLAEAALPHYDGPALRRYNARVDQELDNCRAAMRWALHHDAAETGVRLAGALWRVWRYALATGDKPWWERVREGRSWCERMLAISDGLSVEARTEAFTGAGFLALIQGDHGPVQRLGEELLARARAERYPYGEWWALHLLGSLAKQQGRDVEAAPFFERGLAVAPAVRNPENHAAMSLLELGASAHRAGALDRAADRLEEAVTYCRRSGNPAVSAQVLFARALVWRDQGDRASAAACLNEALGLVLGQHDLAGMHATLVELAKVMGDVRRGEAAARLLALASRLPGHAAYRDMHDEAVQTVQATLTPTEFSVAWETGCSLAWDDIPAVVADLTSEPAHPSPASAAVRDTWHGLTPREVEVLRLLAEGHSNRAIGDALSISERTVEVHVRHILTKLALESRSAAATYAVRHGVA